MLFDKMLSMRVCCSRNLGSTLEGAEDAAPSAVTLPPSDDILNSRHSKPYILRNIASKKSASRAHHQ